MKMDCLNSNCNISGNERMVSCWLCLGSCHLKCSGLKARDADALLDPVKSLLWSCPRCKNIHVEFYKFFKNFKSEYDKMNNELLSLQKRLSNFGELFTNYPNLDKFNSVQNRELPEDSTLNIPLLTISGSATPPNSIQIGDTATTDTCTHQPINSVPSSKNVTTANSISPQSRHISPSTSPITNNQTSHQLRIIPPRKTIFATRFHQDTKVADVSNYIASKLKIDLNDSLKVFKINARNRASFKIIVPIDYLDEIVNSKFWFDIIVITETWLKNSTFNSEILCNNYQIFRCDRDDKRGGGVLKAVSTLYPAE